MRSWLRQLRKEKNLSQQNMADIMGITKASYNFIETGRRMPDLKLSIAVKISEIFNISLDEIKKQEEKEPQK